MATSRIYITRCIVMTLVLVGATACTNKQLYRAAQQNQLSKCDEMLPQEQAECREAQSMSYEEYEKQRSTLKNQNNR